MKKVMIAGIAIFIIFFISGTLSWFMHDKEKNKNLKYTQSYDANEIKSLSIKASGGVHIKQGKQFKVKYYSDNKVTMHKYKGTLRVMQTKSSNRGYSVNVNPFRTINYMIEIEVPSKMLKHLTIDAPNNKLIIDGIQSAETTIYKGVDSINITNCHFDNAEINGDNYYMNINNSKMRSSRFKVDSGGFNIENSQMNDSIFLANQGDIRFEDMPRQSNLKAATKNGDINFAYKRKPKNTLLKLHPGHGKSVVTQSAFKEGKVGISHNILEFYTTDGDIIIQ